MRLVTFASIDTPRSRYAAARRVLRTHRNSVSPILSTGVAYDASRPLTAAELRDRVQPRLAARRRAQAHAEWLAACAAEDMCF